MLISVDNALPTFPNLITIWERPGLFQRRTGSSETRLAILEAGEPRALTRKGHPEQPSKPEDPELGAGRRCRQDPPFPQQPAAGLAHPAGSHSLDRGGAGDTDHSQGLQA